MRRFSDDLIGASSFEAVADVLAEAVRAGAIPVLIEELDSRARSEAKTTVRARCAELARLLREVERASLFEALTACRRLLRKLMTIVAAETWIERDRLLQRYVTLTEQSPSITMAWFFLTNQDTKYIRRLISAFKRVEASSSRRGFITSADDDKERLRLLVEDLSSATDRDERFAVLQHYADHADYEDVLRNRVSDEEMEKAFSDSYHGWRVKRPRRNYLKLLLRWCMELGVAEAGEAHERHSEELLSLVTAETDDERLAVLERMPHIITRDSVTFINFWLTLDETMPDGEIDKAERAREIVCIALQRPSATAVQLSRRKRELTVRHLVRLLTARSTRKQVGILRRNEDTLVSAHAAQRLDILRRTYEQQQALSPALQTAFDWTRVVLAEARGDDVWAAISLLETFQSFMDVLDDGEAAIAKAIEENELTFGDRMDRALTLLGEIYLRGSDAFARALVRFGGTVSRAFASNQEFVAFALRAVELARRDERLSPSQRAYSDQVSAELYEWHGEIATAIERYELALAAYTEQRLSAGEALVHAKLTELYAANHDRDDWLERVETHANAALRLFRDSDIPPKTTVPLLLALADAYAEQADESHRLKAADYYAEALALAPDDAPLQVRCNQTLAALLRRLGRTKEAIDALRVAHARQRELARASDNPSLRGAFGISLRFIVSALFDLLLTPETPAAERIEAFEILDEAKGWELQHDTAFTSLLYAEGFPEVPTEARSKLLAYLQQRYAMNEMEPEALAEFDDILRSAAAEALAPLRSEVDDPDQFDKFIADIPEFYTAMALRLAYGGQLEVVHDRVVTWKEATALLEKLGDRTAVVSYLVTDECTHSLLLRQGLDAPEYVRIPLGEELLRLRFWTSYVREVLERGADRRQARHAWQELGELLLAPLETLLRDVEVLYVVADERLPWLPFNALHIDGQPYCFRRAVVMMPSVDYFERRVRLLASPAEEVGTVGAVGYTANEGERELFESEAKAVAEYFGGEWLAGDDATRQRVADLAGRLTGVLHVSAHGRQSGERDEEPVLYLADGELPALDWMTDVRSTVRLCTFSACEVGRAQLSHRKPFYGFPRAALLGGAHAVLAPLWSVDAKAAADFCLSFYQLTWSFDGRRKLPLAEGYRRALAAQAERPGIGVHDWAGFSLAGDGR